MAGSTAANLVYPRHQFAAVTRPYMALQPGDELALLGESNGWVQWGAHPFEAWCKSTATKPFVSARSLFLAPSFSPISLFQLSANSMSTLAMMDRMDWEHRA